VKFRDLKKIRSGKLESSSQYQKSGTRNWKNEDLWKK